MACACRLVTDYHPYGNTYAVEQRVEICAGCYQAQLDDEADELQAEAENARMAEFEAMERARLECVR